MAKLFPIVPAHPERICWGCDKYCSSNAMLCGNGSERTPHMSELFGDDWLEWGLGQSPATEASPINAEAVQEGSCAVESTLAGNPASVVSSDVD